MTTLTIDCRPAYSAKKRIISTDFLTSISIKSARYTRLMLQGNLSVSYNRKHALSETGCPSLLYPGSSSAGPGWEVSPWQHRRAPVLREQLIGGEVESDGGGRNEWGGTYGCMHWDMVQICLRGWLGSRCAATSDQSTKTNLTVSFWTLIASVSN